MKIKNTEIPGLKIIEPSVFEDSRGAFFESYNYKLFAANGIDTEFVQDNQSVSKYGVLRGLHYQLEPYAQAKLVRVLQGEVLDIAVDLRQGSPTFGKWQAFILSEKNRIQIFIPRGFAHGFLVLSETAEFFYKCDNFYSKEHEAGIRFDDATLNIDWKFDIEKMIISDKDSALPDFKEAVYNFSYQQEIEL